MRVCAAQRDPGDVARVVEGGWSGRWWKWVTPRLGAFQSLKSRNAGHDGLDVLLGQLALEGVVDLDLLAWFHIRTVTSASVAIS